MIHRSKLFYSHLRNNPSIKDVFYHFKSLLSVSQYELLFSFVQKFKIHQKAKILDWGCGNGWFSYYLLNVNFENVTSYVYGWDDIKPAMKLIDKLKVVNGEESNLSNPSQLPFSDGEFSLLFSIGVLEHVHETGGQQIESLKEINRVLKLDGTFYCYHLPNKYTWIENFKRKFLPKEKQAYLHTKKFTASEIRRLLTDTGFEIVHLKRYNFLPYNIFRKNKIDKGAITWLYRLLDTLACKTPLNIFCQCYMFEAQKKRNYQESKHNNAS